MNYRKSHRGKLVQAMAEIDVMNRRWQHKNYSPQCIGFASSTTNNSSTLSSLVPQRSRQSCVTTHGIPSHSLSVCGSGGGGDIHTQICEISEGLFLSGARAIKITKLRDLGITAIVNATIELPNLPFENVEYVKVCVEDSPFANLSYYFDRIADKIEEVRRRGGNTLVHCVAGVSRSASLCIAYMMKHKRMSLRKAYQHVKARRHIVRPNPGFFRQLIEYEARVLGTSSVTMVWNAAAGGHIPDVYEPEYNNTMSYLAKYGSSTSKGPGSLGSAPCLLGSSVGGRGDQLSSWNHHHHLIPSSNHHQHHSSSSYRRL